MKYLLLITLFFMACEIPHEKVSKTGSINDKIIRYERIEGDMKYFIYHDYVHGGIIVVNLTKDSLECESLRQQLELLEITPGSPPMIFDSVFRFSGYAKWTRKQQLELLK